GDDEIRGENYGGGGFLSGSDYDDTIYGGDGNDVLEGEYGDNIVYGGDGNDTLISETVSPDVHVPYGTNSDTLYGEGGNDTLYVAAYSYGYGGSGSDLYESRQDANPSVVSNSYIYDLSGSHDELNFYGARAGLTISYSQSGNDLIMQSHYTTFGGDQYLHI